MWGADISIFEFLRVANYTFISLAIGGVLYKVDTFQCFLSILSRDWFVSKSWFQSSLSVEAIQREDHRNVLTQNSVFPYSH